MNHFYWLTWTVLRGLFRLYFRWRILNVASVPSTCGAIFAPNHASLVDPFIVGAAVPRQTTYLARETLFRFAPLGWLLRKWSAVPLDRDRGSAAGLRIVFERLRQGDAVLLFPEGTRTRDGKLQPARSGIGLIVIKSEVPVVPVRVFGTFEAMRREAWLPLPRRVTVRFGQPLQFVALRNEAKNCSKARLKAIYQQVADEIMAAISELESGEDKAPSA